MSQKIDEINEPKVKKLKTDELEEINNEKCDFEDPSLFQKGIHFGIRERVNKKNKLFNAIIKQRYYLCNYLHIIICIIF